MRFILSATLIVALCLGFVHAFVPEWDDDDFQSEISKHEIVLVMFYAPWCGYSRQLAPKYEEASEALRSHDTPVTLAKVDCSAAGKKTCAKFKVKGFPTLTVFRNGEIFGPYIGEREKDAIIDFMEEVVDPNSTTSMVLKILGST